MSELHGIARMRIHPGKLDEFKRLSAACMEVSRTKDRGTLGYDLYFNRDETECVVHERYRDSDALLEHFQNLGELAAAILGTCTAEGEILGDASPALRQALDGAPVRIFTPYASL